MRDPSWVKSRIAARILLRQHDGKILSRDRRLALLLASDRGITDRLVDQAVASISVQQHRDYQDIFSRMVVPVLSGGGKGPYRLRDALRKVQ